MRNRKKNALRKMPASTYDRGKIKTKQKKTKRGEFGGGRG
jgi:hypothetical protein